VAKLAASTAPTIPTKSPCASVFSGPPGDLANLRLWFENQRGPRPFYPTAASKPEPHPPDYARQFDLDEGAP